MEALKAASSFIRPISVLSEKRSSDLRRVSSSSSSSSLPNLSPLPKKSPPPRRSISHETFLRSFNGGLALLTSVFTSTAAAISPPARSLTYEEALNQSVTSTTTSDGLIDGILGFVTENPLVIPGGFAVLAVPIVLSQVLSRNPKSWGVESARNGYARLGSDPNAQLLDIRGARDLRQVGYPDLKGCLGKRAVSVVYSGEDKPGFLKKLSLKFKEPENTTLVILDKFDGNSELVAELVALNGFKAAYAIKDGVEGPRGWLNSGLPWIEPKKTLSLDLSSFTDSFAGVIGENDGISVAAGVAAAAGLGVLAFSEIETILQLLGSAAIVQFASKKLLYAEDRKQTLKQVDEFLNTKVAPRELVDELKQIGKALLPPSTSSKALPAAVAAAEVATESPTASATATIEKPEPEPQPAPAQANSAPPRTEAKPESHPRPLSPYASYPDLKPPASPTPSQP